MAYSNRYNNSQSYAPSAPSFPGEQSPYTSAAAAPNYYAHHSQSYPHGTTTTSSSNSSYGSYGQQYPPSSSSSSSEFPAGTHPDVIRSFQTVDRDRSGFIDGKELQQALSSTYHWFSLRTIRLLIFLFKNPNAPLTIGQFLFLFLGLD